MRDSHANPARFIRSENFGSIEATLWAFAVASSTDSSEVKTSAPLKRYNHRTEDSYEEGSSEVKTSAPLKDGSVQAGRRGRGDSSEVKTSAPLKDRVFGYLARKVQDSSEVKSSAPLKDSAQFVGLFR